MLFDQSLFVRAAVDGVVKEACIAAGLTALAVVLSSSGAGAATIVVIVSHPAVDPRLDHGASNTRSVRRSTS